MFVPVKQCNYFTFPRESKHRNPTRRFLRPNPSIFSFYLFIFKWFVLSLSSLLCLELRNHKPNQNAHSHKTGQRKHYRGGKASPFWATLSVPILAVPLGYIQEMRKLYDYAGPIILLLGCKCSLALGSLKAVCELWTNKDTALLPSSAWCFLLRVTASLGKYKVYLDWLEVE